MSNRRRITWAVGLIIALNVALGLANEFLPSGRISGPSGSSFVTDANGTGAWRELLLRTGSGAAQITQSLSEYPLDPQTTLIITDIRFASDTETDPVVAFVENGGHLVLALGPGVRSEFWDALQIESNGPTTSQNRFTPAVASGSITQDISEVTTSGEVAFDHPHGQALLASPEGVLAYEEALGEGTVIMVADASVFSNRHLADTDNAAFAVAVTKGRDVVFNEFGHGFLDEPSPEPVLPKSWSTTAYLLAISLLLYLLAIGRRFGPPESVVRTLHPPRTLFVESLASTLGRTPLADAAEPVRTEAIRRAFRKAGLGRDAAFAELVNLAPSIGIAPEDLRSIEHGVGSEEAALAAGRVLSAASNTSATPSLSSTNVPAQTKGT